MKNNHSAMNMIDRSIDTKGKNDVLANINYPLIFLTHAQLRGCRLFLPDI